MSRISSPLTLPEATAPTKEDTILDVTILAVNVDDAIDQDLPSTTTTTSTTEAKEKEEIQDSAKDIHEKPVHDTDMNHPIAVAHSLEPLPVVRPSQLLVSVDGREEYRRILERPMYVSITLTKPPNRIGIAMRMDQDRVLRVTEIHEDSLLGAAPICVGDELVRINGQDCRRGCKSVVAVQMMQQTQNGLVTIVTRHKNGNPNVVWNHAVKSQPDSTLGITLVERNGDVRVQSLNAGLLRHSMLSVGDRVLAVNNVSCCDGDTSVEEAIALLRSAETGVTIATPYTEPQSRPAYISATVHKKRQKIGLGMRVVDGQLRVVSLVPFGLFAASPVRVSDAIVSINGIDCRNCPSAKDACDLVEKLSGWVTVVTRVDGGNPSMVATMITKPTPDALVGIVMSQRGGNGFIVVRGILEDGLLMNSLLNVGDRLVSINGQDCSGMSVADATEIIRCAPKTVTFVALSQPEAGAVISSLSSQSSDGNNTATAPPPAPAPRSILASDAFNTVPTTTNTTPTIATATAMSTTTTTCSFASEVAAYWASVH